MPALRQRKTPREIGNDEFRGILSHTIETQETSKPDLADNMGVSLTTFYKRWDKPEDVTVRELFGLYVSGRITKADIIKIITGEDST